MTTAACSTHRPVPARSPDPPEVQGLLRTPQRTCSSLFAASRRQRRDRGSPRERLHRCRSRRSLFPTRPSTSHTRPEPLPGCQPTWELRLFIWRRLLSGARELEGALRRGGRCGGKRPAARRPRQSVYFLVSAPFRQIARSGAWPFNEFATERARRHASALPPDGPYSRESRAGG